MALRLWKVAVSLADPSGGPVIATSSTVLPCPAVPSGILSGLHLPSFSTNLVAGCALQDGGVHQFTPAYERVTHCTCARTGRHLATFTRQPGSDLYTLTTESPQVAASASVSASGQLSAPCSCRSLAHKTVLWHHRLGHPSVQRLRGMHSRYLVSGLPRVLPPLPPSLAPPCLPCVEGRQRAAPHSSSFPPTTAPLQMLHMDVWGPARVRRQGRERYFLIVVDDYSRYTTVFPLHTKGEVPDVLIPWISRARLQLRERFRSEFPVLCLHSDRGGEFSSDLLAAYCAEHGIRQSFTLPASPQQNGVAERRVGLVMEVARTSLVHAAAPHFLWPFAVRYAAHQLNLWPRVSALETSPTLLWTGEVGDASRFRVWGSRAFVRDTSADKLSSRTAPCVFLGFVPDASGWQFYHPASHRVFPSQDVTFDESVPFYRLFPYRTAPLPPPPLFLAPGAAVVDPLPPQGAAPFGVSQVDPVEPAEVAVDSRPARGAEPERAEPERAEPERAEPGGAESGGAETGGAEPGGTESGGTEPGVAESGGAKPGGVAVDCEAPGGPPSSQQLREWYSRYCSLRRRASRARGATGGGTRVSPPRREAPSSPQLREWYARHISLRSGAAGAGVPGVDAAAGAADPGAGGTAAAGGAAGGAASTEDPGVGAAAGAADPAAGGAASAAGGAAAAAGVENPEVGASAGAEDPAAGVSAGSGVAARPRPYFNPLLQQVLGQPPPPCPPLALECPPSVESQPQLPPASPLPVPATYTGPTGGLAERREPTSRPVSSSVACLCCYHWSSCPASTSSCCPRHSPDGASLHEEIWLRRPPGFTGSFPPGTQWSLRRPVYGLRQAPREWHDTLRTTLAVIGFAPSTADPSLFLRTDTSLPPFYILVYVDDLVFATSDTAGLTLVKSELQKRHTCTDLGELTSYLGLRITRDRARRTITLTQSHMVQQVLQRFGFTYSSPQSTPLPTGHSLLALPSDESVEPSGPYPELVGCLITSGMGLVLGGRDRPVLTGHSDASWADDQAAQRSSQGYTFSLGSGSVSWRSTRSSSVLSSSCEAEIYATAMAAQELRWLTYLLTDLGEQPRSPPVLYVDNKATIALCGEHRLEHRTKHIALRYFLARELQQRGQLCLRYVATRANTADVFTKALQLCDHQRFCTVLVLVPTVPHLLTS
ncbi:unnamed protein product [Closterium sp. NIES-54]